MSAWHVGQRVPARCELRQEPAQLLLLLRTCPPMSTCWLYYKYESFTKVCISHLALETFVHRVTYIGHPQNQCYGLWRKKVSIIFGQYQWKMANVCSQERMWNRNSTWVSVKITGVAQGRKIWNKTYKLSSIKKRHELPYQNKI